MVKWRRLKTDTWEMSIFSKRDDKGEGNSPENSKTNVAERNLVN